MADEERRQFDELQSKLGVRFREPGLLHTAFVHRSYLNENPGQGLESNERLEFLGDAVLGFVIGRWLYRQYPDLPEGQLTEMRAQLVRRETLAQAAARLNLGEHLLLGVGENRAGGRDRELNLACAFEAVVGAVAEDGGLEEAERFSLRALAPEVETLESAGLLDAKSRLQHVVQSRWHLPPRYEVTAAAGPDHAKQFTVTVTVAGERMGTGTGRSKQDAERDAARQTLQLLGASGVTPAEAED